MIAGALAGCLRVWEYKHCAFVTTCDRVNTCHVLTPYVALARGSHGGGVTFEKATQAHLIPLAKFPVVLVRVSAPFSFYFLGVLFVSSLWFLPFVRVWVN